MSPLAPKAASAASSQHFRPKPMSPPWKGCTPVEYTNYVASYKIYVAALNEAKAEFWKSATPASKGLPREVQTLSHDFIRNPQVWHVRTPDDRATMATLPSYAEAAKFASNFKGGALGSPFVKHAPEESIAKVVSLGVIPKERVISTSTLTEEQSKAKAERKTAARRRQRHARALRDKAASVQELRLKADLENAKLEAAKSSQRLASWVTVSNRRTSKLPVKTGPVLSSPPISRPAWYPTTKEAALRLQKLWGSGN